MKLTDKDKKDIEKVAKLIHICDHGDFNFFDRESENLQILCLKANATTALFHRFLRKLKS
ncbi:MAG: hypothetical protein IPH96_18060 [Saprospiraceae bacterium]|nr:hypothetical protein [Saprospiraceae bacterium]